MTPQASFMVAAPVPRSRLAELRELLSTMNGLPGVAEPANPLVPFGALENLHFARFVVLDDQTLGDRAAYRITSPEPPLYLAFLGDFDGDYDEFIRDLVQRAGAGLRRIFSFCDGFSPAEDLASWMKTHEHRPSTEYCNYVGRTMKQCREEARLRRALLGYIAKNPQLADAPPDEVHARLRDFARNEQSEGRLTLTPPGPTPLSWTLRHVFQICALAVLIVGGIVTLPLTILPLLIVAWRLRSLETGDPQIAPPPDTAHIARLQVLEDYDVANQFSAMGTLKPGLFRRWLLTAILWIVNLTTHVLYAKGRLARVHTIHFARWVFIDRKTRLLFASNYDGSLESYMDDFINKVAFGLNAVFSNGIGYPATDWLVLRGAKNEQAFKYFIRRHELPTEVWYNGHAGFTAHDLERNSLIRQGLQASSMTDSQAREWLTLL